MPNLKGSPAANYQHKMFCKLYQIDLGLGADALVFAVEACKLQQGIFVGYSSKEIGNAYLKAPLIKRHLQLIDYNEVHRNIKMMYKDDIQPKELKEPYLSAMWEELTIKQSCFCHLVSKGVHTTTAAEICEMGAKYASQQSMGNRAYRNKKLKDYIAHLKYEDMDLDMLLG